jgi:hypothetical protein
MIFYQVKRGLILSIFASFIFVEAKFKLTKKQKQSPDLYSLLLLYPAGENSLFLLCPAVGHSLFLLSLTGKQFDHTYFYREETNIYLYCQAQASPSWMA